jgi:hypothetical protein
MGSRLLKKTCKQSGTPIILATWEYHSSRPAWEKQFVRAHLNVKRLGVWCLPAQLG